MCGRFGFIDGKGIFQTFSSLSVQEQRDLFVNLPRYNISPMQKIPVFAIRDAQLKVQQMQWWLVPHWSKDGKTTATTFNARAEGLHESKLYATYFKSSRCLIPADLFYEWKQVIPDKPGEGKRSEKTEKHPYCIRMRDETPFMFAGLFSVWKNEKGEEFPSCSIITTVPNSLMSEIHNRMPVILPEKHFMVWLDRDYKSVEELKKLLVPFPSEKMKAYRVSRYLNNSKNEGPECIKDLMKV